MSTDRCKGIIEFSGVGHWISSVFSIYPCSKKCGLETNVAETDPYVFGPPGPVSHKYGSGSGSFHHQAKMVRKP
jgi:hypothetical protein